MSYFQTSLTQHKTWKSNVKAVNLQQTNGINPIKHPKVRRYNKMFRFPNELVKKETLLIMRMIRNKK